MRWLNILRKIDVDDFESTDEQLESVFGGDFVTGLLIAGIAISYYLNTE